MDWIIAIFIGAIGVSFTTILIIVAQTRHQHSDDEIEQLLQKDRDKRKPKRPALDSERRLRY